jgi:DNA-binding transcriptional LysR family regulator
VSKIFTNVNLVRHLDLLGVFALVVETGSMSEAGRRAALTRSAVSHRIRRLEEEVGVRLLRRTTRAVVATDAGVALFERAADLLDVVERTEALLEDLADHRPISIQLAGIVAEYISPALLAFAQANPGRISLHVRSAPADLMATTDDILIRVTRTVPENWVARSLGSVALRVVAAPAYLARRGRPTHPDDLRAHDLIRYTAVRADQEWRVDGRAVPVRSDWHADDSQVARQLAIVGAGIAVLPDFAVRHAVEREELVVLDGLAVAPATLWAILPAGRQSSPRARAFVADLRQLLALGDQPVGQPIEAD